MTFDWGAYGALITVSSGYSPEKGIFPRVTHPSAALPERSARLACIRPAASVRSEPGSNSQVEYTAKRSVLTFKTFAHHTAQPHKRSDRITVHVPYQEHEPS